jgi:hypothetical protein
MPAPSTSRSRIATAGPLVAVLVLGAALRISQLHQSLYGDELWSWVGATKPSFGGMLDWVRSDQEITPPMFTSLAWLSAKLGDPTTLIRLPSVLAGIATIPLVYALAIRSFGRRVALTAATLAALSPFLAFYSVEARAYGLAVALVAASTLSMLIASERARSRGWWIAYGAFSSAAMYTHYTAVYVLAAQFLWLLWFRPDARRAATLANLAAAAVFLLWLPGFLEDLDSPAQQAFGLLAPFTLHTFSVFTGSFALGHPAAGLNTLYGTWAEAALLGGLAIALAGAVASALRARGSGREPAESVATANEIGGLEAIILFAGMGLAAPVGVALVSLLGTDMYFPRNLATSLPALLIAISVLLNAGPPGFRAAALTLVIGAFGYGAFQTIQPRWQRPAVREAAEYVNDHSAPGDVVLDVAWLATPTSPGTQLTPPALTLDVNLDAPGRAVDATTPAVVRGALADARGHRLFIVGIPVLVEGARELLGLDEGQAEFTRTYDGVPETELDVFNQPTAKEVAGR